MDEVARDVDSSDGLDINFDEATSVIDMEDVAMRRALSRSRTKSMMNADTLRALREAGLFSDGENDAEREQHRSKAVSRVSWKGNASRPVTRGSQGVIVMSPELCSLQ